MVIICLILSLILLFIGVHYLGKYHEHKHKLRAQRHHVEWILSELDRQRKDRDAEDTE